MTTQRPIDWDAVFDSLPPPPAPWIGQDDYEKAFEAWMASEHGSRIYREVAGRALRLHAMGRRHYSIAGLFESVRFDWAVSGKDEHGFKLNNNHKPRVARRIMEDFPELAGFFELRTLRT